MDVEVNENVSAGATVATVNCGETIEVDVSIPESFIAGLEPGMPASVRFDALGDAVLAATVTSIGIAAQEDSTFPVTVTLEGAHPDLRSGLAAEVSLQIAQAGGSSALLVPLSAVVGGSDGPFVFLAEPTGEGRGKVTRRAVSLGELTADGMEVTSGLEVGERVITAGVSVIYEGLEVLVEDVPVDDAPASQEAAGQG